MPIARSETSLHKSLLKRIGAALEWPVVSKVHLVALGSSSMIAIHDLFRRYFFARISIQPSIHWGAERSIERWELIVVIGWLLLSLIGLWAKRAPRREALYEYLATQYFAISWAGFGAAIGQVSFSAGVFSAGAPFLGLLLFRARAVLFGMASAIAVLVTTAVLAASGTIPYAPLYRVPGFADGRVQGWWIAAEAALGLPFLVLTMAMTWMLLARWRERERGLVELSTIDPLTGVANRRHVMTELALELERQRDGHYPPSVILVDLDNFKRINDAFGHLEGDRTLRRAAQTLRDCLRTSDLVGRYGGEEFIIILRRADRSTAASVAERCRAKLAELLLSDDNGREYRITASFGVSACEASDTLDTLIKRVDAALYRAKDQGRNRVSSTRHPDGD